ncbi:endopeptidase La [bacterium]|nr:endopeptidase La [bacterium]
MRRVRNIGSALPVVPLRGMVVFPNTVTSILVGRRRSVEAVEYVSMGKRTLFLVAQKEPAIEEPTAADLFRVGTVVKIIQIMGLPDGTMKLLVEGLYRAKVMRFNSHRNFMTAIVYPFTYKYDRNDARVEALMRQIRELYQEYLSLTDMPEEMVKTLNIEKPMEMADVIAAQISTDFRKKQEILEAETLKTLLEKLLEMLVREIDVLRLKREINLKVRDMIDSSQREFYLRQQLEAIKRELGEEYGASEGEIDELMQRANSGDYPEKVREVLLKEIKKLSRIPPTSPEAGVIRSYIDWLFELPWNKTSQDSKDLKESERILNEDHYGLEKIKQRITEHIAVMMLSDSPRGPILCFVGPPGVGKTSVAQSVARALGRKFVRASLGGLHDEAEIRGHRRTYIGAMPGKIIQGIRRAGTKNPVFLLDEIDKIGHDYRGDPAAALMEVLDPEQNKTFMDNYIEIPFDLSQVMFITTANTLQGIPEPLLDRMEILRLPGYLETEKVIIARDFLLPKAIKRNGLVNYKIEFTEAALKRIIRNYTREAGVRELERKIDEILRKIAVKIAGNKTRKKKFTIDESDVDDYLGVPPYVESPIPERLVPGEALGLAWTSFGGELLRVEALLLPGKGTAKFTGMLGDVLKESVEAALSLVRSRADVLGFNPEKVLKSDIHIHFPEGAVPKDGPSAGVAIFSAVASLLAGRPLPNDIAMTGEITLTGRVLKIGGLPEKLLAARRYGIKRVVIPKLNENDLKEVKPEILSGLEIIPVSTVDEVLELVSLRK